MSRETPPPLPPPPPSPILLRCKPLANRAYTGCGGARRRRIFSLFFSLPPPCWLVGFDRHIAHRLDACAPKLPRPCKNGFRHAPQSRRFRKPDRTNVKEDEALSCAEPPPPSFSSSLPPFSVSFFRAAGPLRCVTVALGDQRAVQGRAHAGDLPDLLSPPLPPPLRSSSCGRPNTAVIGTK